VAGKTGTGQNWGDAWFVGYTPDMVTGVWVGFTEGQIPMVPPTTRIRVTGGSWPAQIWQLYMTAALAEVPIVDFPEPLISSEQETADALIGQVVTNAVGMEELLATEILTRAGFVVSVEYVADSNYPPGIVADSLPAPGATVEGGTDMLLFIANGERTGRVPTILGRNKPDAIMLLERVDYEINLIQTAEVDTDAAQARAGLVWKVEPRAGTRLTSGETVTVWVNPES